VEDNDLELKSGQNWSTVIVDSFSYYIPLNNGRFIFSSIAKKNVSRQVIKPRYNKIGVHKWTAQQEIVKAELFKHRIHAYMVKNIRPKIIDEIRKRDILIPQSEDCDLPEGPMKGIKRDNKTRSIKEQRRMAYRIRKAMQERKGKRMGEVIENPKEEKLDPTITPHTESENRPIRRNRRRRGRWVPRTRGDNYDASHTVDSDSEDSPRQKKPRSLAPKSEFSDDRPEAGDPVGSSSDDDSSDPRSRGDPIDVESAIQDISAAAESSPSLTEQQQEIVDRWMNHFEKMLIFAWYIAKAEHMSDYLMAVMTYVKMYYSERSLIKTIYGALKDMVSEEETITPHTLPEHQTEAMKRVNTSVDNGVFLDAIPCSPKFQF
jgi:hypothetical protein